MFDISAFSLQGKKAIVTGGTRGLGRQIAEAYHNMGADVVIWGRRPEGAQTAASMDGPRNRVYFVCGDISRADQMDAMLAQSLKYLDGRVDILVNAAGIQYRAPAADFPQEAWDQVIAVNLSAVFRLSQKVGRQMCGQKKGRIINIASMCSFFGSVQIPAYTASKGGVMQLTRALSNEWAGCGVTVNAIAPGYMQTVLTADIQRNNPAQYEMITSRIPKGRWGRPEDIQGLSVFLASDASEYLTGAIIPLDGGYLGY